MVNYLLPVALKGDHHGIGRRDPLGPLSDGSFYRCCCRTFASSGPLVRQALTAVGHCSTTRIIHWYGQTWLRHDHREFIISIAQRRLSEQKTIVHKGSARHKDALARDLARLWGILATISIQLEQSRLSIRDSQ